MRRDTIDSLVARQGVNIGEDVGRGGRLLVGAPITHLKVAGVVEAAFAACLVAHRLVRRLEGTTARVHGVAALADVPRSVGSLPGASQSTAKHALEQRPQRRNAAGNDAHIALHHGPDAHVARVPEPVAGLAVVDDRGDFSNSRTAREAAQPERQNQRGPCSPVDVEVPEHGHGNDDGEEEVREDVESHVGVREALKRLGPPANRGLGDLLVPQRANVGTLADDRLSKTVSRHSNPHTPISRKRTKKHPMV